MSDGKIGFRVRIIPTVMEGLRLTYVNCKTVLFVCWVPFVLLTLFGWLHYWDAAVDFFSPTLLMGKMTPTIVDGLLTSPIIIALYRVYLLREQGYFVWHYKRGIMQPKTVYSLPWFFTFKRREVLSFLLFIFIAFFSFFLGWVNRWWAIQSATPYGEIENFSFFMFNGYLIIFIEHILFVVVTFVWPMIALSNTYNLQSFTSSLKYIKGNIIRLYIMTQITYAPLLILIYLEPILYYFPYNIYGDIANEAYYILKDIIYFLCLCVHTAWISALYKEFALDQKAEGSK